MNVSELSKMIGKIAKGIRLVNSYYDDDLKEVWNTREVKYGSVVWNVSSVSLEDNIWVYNGYLYYGDRLNEAGTNINSIFSDATTVIQTIISVIYNNVDLVSEIEDYPAINYFKNKYADELAGCYVSLSIRVANEYSSCDDGYDVRTLLIKENGLYNVTGYDMADVYVQESGSANIEAGENITITEDGDKKIINAVDMRYNDSALQSRVDGVQGTANGAYALAQSVESVAGQALGTANGAYALAQSIEPTANNALGQANNAMGKANDAFSFAQSVETNLNTKEGLLYTKIADVQSYLEGQIAEFKGEYNNWESVPDESKVGIKDFTITLVFFDVDGDSYKPAISFRSADGYSQIYGFVEITSDIMESKKFNFDFISGTVKVVNQMITIDFENYFESATFKGGGLVFRNSKTIEGHYQAFVNATPVSVMGYNVPTPTANDYIAVKDTTAYNNTITDSWIFVYQGNWADNGKSGWKPAYKYNFLPDVDSVSAYNGMNKINQYLYSISYNNISYTDAKAHFTQLKESNTGACSLIRENNKIGRNFDWNINNQVEFLVKTSNTGKHYSVIGVASVAGINTDNISRYNEEFKYLPFRLLDGMNERGLVCSVNQLPTSDKTISKLGTIPAVQYEDSISMFMLTRYILDNFDDALKAVQYIQSYIRIVPILDTEDNPLDFHYCVADRTQTIYMYFEGRELKYEVKPNDKFVMTNFRLVGTNLVNGYYSVADSNIESFGQGVERANCLIDYFDLNTVSFTKAYTTTERLTDFAGIEGATISDTTKLASIQARALSKYNAEAIAGSLRTNADLWQTVHSVIYDLDGKTVKLKVQEIENYIEYEFKPYSSVNYEEFEELKALVKSLLNK